MFLCVRYVVDYLMGMQYAPYIGVGWWRQVLGAFQVCEGGTLTCRATPNMFQQDTIAGNGRDMV